MKLWRRFTKKKTSCTQLQRSLSFDQSFIIRTFRQHCTRYHAGKAGIVSEEDRKRLLMLKHILPTLSPQLYLPKA